MRTTVSLDPDIAAELREPAHERGTSLSDVLNATVRAGLFRAFGQTPARPYRLEPYRIGCVRTSISPGHCVMAADLEDDEIVRRPPLGN